MLGMDAADLPDDVDTLKKLLRETLDAKRVVDAENAQLREQLRLMLAKRFGPSSEKQPPEQMGLFNEVEATACEEAAEPEETVQVPAHERAKRGRRPLPDLLPRVEVIHDLPESEKICPHDGTPLKHIGDDVSEQLDVIPATVQVLRNVRRKYACPCCEGHVVRAPLPPQPIPRSIASPGLLAYVCTAKYVDALPLHRQEAILGRLGIDLPRATLANWMMALGELVLPLINLLREQLLAYDIVQMDETTVQVLKEEGRAATSQSYLWVRRGGPPANPILLFDYDPSRAGAVATRLLPGFRGYLQTDGYAGYNAVAGQEGIVALGCWAHARRKFDEAIKAQGGKAKPGRATRALSLIQRLYRVELLAKDLDPEARRTLRLEQAVPVLDEIRAWLDQSLAQVPPKGKLGEALGYLDGQWSRLVRYIDDGRLAIDNNAVERAIRPFVIGRRNWLFSDTPKGADTSARLYSLIETAKANGLEPYAYLSRVFKELPAARTAEDFEALLPFKPTPPDDSQSGS
jgi:transposase